jgi:hypothetical protein
VFVASRLGQRKSIGDVAAFIALSARLPMPDKDIMFLVKIYCPINFLPPEPQPNSITSAQWYFRQASHIANAYVGGRLCFHFVGIS